MELRTDLALEKREILGEAKPNGVECKEFTEGNVHFTKIKILDKNGSDALREAHRNLYYRRNSAADEKSDKR